MARKKAGKNGLSGETRMIRLHYDGTDKYSQPVYVGLNNMNWVIKRGEWVEVPVEVYDILMRSEAQDNKTAMLVRELEEKAKAMGAI